MQHMKAILANFWKRDREFIEHLMESFSRGCHLDLAPGYSPYMNTSRNVTNITYMDKDPAVVAYLRQEHIGATVHKGDILRARTYPIEYFDTISCFNILQGEHQYDKFFACAHMVLRPDFGTIFGSVKATNTKKCLTIAMRNSGLKPQFVMEDEHSCFFIASNNNYSLVTQKDHKPIVKDPAFASVCK